MALTEHLDVPQQVVDEDSHLLRKACDGDLGAFDSLYRRHYSAAHKLAYVVAGNATDADDALSEACCRVFRRIRSGALDPETTVFRAYLLTATRNAALDVHRARNRRDPNGPAPFIDLTMEADAAPDPSQRVADASDHALIAKAFTDLPERWRSVLWLTEVEGMAATEAAERLGVSPNNASQLAHRARARLRQGDLHAHVESSELPPECEWTSRRLAAFVSGGLAARDTIRVNEHLVTCDDCRQKAAELEDIERSIKLIAFPLVGASGSAVNVLVAAGLVTAGATAVGPGAAIGSGGATAVSPGSWFSAVPGWARKVGAGTVAAAMATGIWIGVTSRGPSSPTALLDRTGDASPTDTRVLSEVVERGGIADDDAQSSRSVRRPRTSLPTTNNPGGNFIGCSCPVPPQGPGSGGTIRDGEDPDPPGVPAPLVSVTAGGSYQGNQLGALVSDSGSGAVAGPISLGTAPTIRPDDGLEIRTGGTVLPPVGLSFP